MLSGGFYHAQTTYVEPSKDRTKSDKTDYKLNMCMGQKPWTITRIIFSGQLLYRME